MSKCNTCTWKYCNHEKEVIGCVYEDEDLFNSPTQFTDKCFGYLEENFEENIMDNEELNKYIDRFDKEKNINIDLIDHINIYNFLLELRMYRNIGTLNEIYKKFGL